MSFEDDRKEISKFTITAYVWDRRATTIRGGHALVVDCTLERAHLRAGKILMSLSKKWPDRRTTVTISHRMTYSPPDANEASEEVSDDEVQAVVMEG